jgi:hypothetical protein
MYQFMNQHLKATKHLSSKVVSVCHTVLDWMKLFYEDIQFSFVYLEGWVMLYNMLYKRGGVISHLTNQSTVLHNTLYNTLQAPFI